MKNEVFTKGKKVYVGIEVEEWIAFLTQVRALENSATSLVGNVAVDNGIKSIILGTHCREVLTDLDGLQKYMNKYIGALSEDLEAANKNKEEC